MSNKKPLITKGNVTVRQLLLVAGVSVLLYIPTHFVLFALAFDVAVPAAIVLAIWNYYDAHRASK